MAANLNRNGCKFKRLKSVSALRLNRAAVRRARTDKSPAPWGRSAIAFFLIADDDELVVEMVRNALSARGHIVGAVDDGKRVVDIAIARQPDLVILDCSMPEVSGIEALRQMRLSPLCPQMRC
jgi:PleD family two-component response regulator